jgi:hypothetical protein
MYKDLKKADINFVSYMEKKNEKKVFTTLIFFNKKEKN